jgi:hypothetical protein
MIGAIFTVFFLKSRQCKKRDNAIAPFYESLTPILHQLTRRWRVAKSAQALSPPDRVKRDSRNPYSSGKQPLALA